MPSGSFKQVDVRCPFYKYDDGKRRIICEGIIDQCSTGLVYHKHSDYETQLSVFCCGDYKKCEVYRMLQKEKYGEDI